jgi:hypothetical protein
MAKPNEKVESVEATDETKIVSRASPRRHSYGSLAHSATLDFSNLPSVDGLGGLGKNLGGIGKKVPFSSMQGKDWTGFAREHPTEFLAMVLDNFSSMRIVQALFVTASLGLLRSSLGHHDSYSRKFGALSALSVFCNLFGIMLGIFVSQQCNTMKSLRATGDEVAEAVSDIMSLTLWAIGSFVLGMSLIATATCLTVFKDQGFEFSVVTSGFAVGLLLLLMYLQAQHSFSSKMKELSEFGIEDTA